MAKRHRINWYVHRLADSSKSQWLLVWFSFLEGVIVPIPLEAILIPYMQLRRDILWRIAGLALIGFLLASVVGYYIGAAAFHTFGVLILDAFGWHESFNQVTDLFARYGFWALILIGLLPIPSQVAMLAGGALDFPILQFVAAMLLSRGVRYFGLAVLVYWLGDATVHYLGRWKAWAARHRTTAILLALGLAALAASIWLMY